MAEGRLRAWDERAEGFPLLAFEGDAHAKWSEGDFEDYEADKIRRLGPDAVEPKRIKYKKFAR